MSAPSVSGQESTSNIVKSGSILYLPARKWIKNPVKSLNKRGYNSPVVVMSRVGSTGSVTFLTVGIEARNYIVLTF
jgi:hypothetical protein